MTAGNYISIAALVVSMVMMIANTWNIKKTQERASHTDKKVDEKQIKAEAAQQTSIMIALDNIKSMLSEIKIEVNTVKSDTRENHDKLLLLEQSYKSEHKRLDTHEEWIKSIEKDLRSTGTHKE